MAECKYHNEPGKVTDVKVSLYIRSRFLDVMNIWEEQPKNRTKYSSTSAEKRQLLEKNVVLCKELCHQPDRLAQIGVNSMRIEETLQEGRFLCQTLIRHGQH